MRRYESLVILDPELPDDEIRSFTERYSGLIRDGGGEIIKIEDWGFKKLAYLVKKRDRGRYVLFDYVGTQALITEVERKLKIAEEALKFISVKLDDDVDLEAFKAASKEKEAAQAPAEAAPTPEPVPAPETAPAESPAPEEPSPAAPAEASAPVETPPAGEAASDAGTGEEAAKKKEEAEVS